MKRPCEQFVRTLKPNGTFGKTEKLASYVVTLCDVDDDVVRAFRVDGCHNKQEALEKLAMQVRTPEMLNIKSVSKLYDEDFNADNIQNLKRSLPEEKDKRLQDWFSEHMNKPEEKS